MSTPRDAAFRVAVLDALSKRVYAALAEARKEAEPLFAAARLEGTKQIEVALPSGAQVGTVSIKVGADTVTMDETALMEWVENNAPTEIETTVSPAALTRPDVVAYVRRFHPTLMGKQVRPAYKTVIVKQLSDDGEFVDTATGELVKVADKVRGEPTGAFVLTFERAKDGRPNGRDQIAAAWASGELSLADLLTVAIEAASDGEA
ncbi:hypothetical protein AB0F88_39740 [Streptosporangium sp. NPDC023963]|uniref:hypothetical protein n=1 Tax=Streptosporangium sp. NPDC023963 TaxID=3155608 RepID=UPI0034146624